VKHYPDVIENLMGLSRDNFIVGAALALGPRRDPLPAWKRIEAIRESVRRQAREKDVEMLSSIQRGKREKLEVKGLEEERTTESNTQCDALIVACFEEPKMKQNVAALATKDGRVRLFGRLLSNVLEDETETRMMSVQPYTLSFS